jgi:hypothetical protein
MSSPIRRHVHHHDEPRPRKKTARRGTRAGPRPAPGRVPHRAAALAVNGAFLRTDVVPALLLFALWTLLASVHLLRRTWRQPAPAAAAAAVARA